MISIWSIGVVITAKSNFSNVAGKVSAQANAANASVSRLQAGMGKFAPLARVASAAMTGFGIASAAAFAVGIKGAADLQDAIAQTAVAMGQSTDSIDAGFTGLALKMSNATAQSVTQSMELLRTLATSGINDPAQMRALAMPIALYADTQYLGKNNTDFNESAALAAKVAHQFGARTANDLAPILNTLFKISQDMPDSLSSAATQLKYYASTYTNQAGVSPQEVLMLQATADRLGYGSGKSGSGFNMILRNLLNPSTAKMSGAQSALGIGGFINSATGAFDVEGLFDKLHADYASARASGNVAAYERLLQSAFSSNAALIAGIMASDAGRSQYKSVEATLRRVPDMQIAQAQLLGTLNNQTKRLVTNFSSLATMLEKPFIPALTRLVSNTADLVGNLTTYFSDHPGQAKIGGGALALGGAYGAMRVGGFILDRLGIGAADRAAIASLRSGGLDLFGVVVKSLGGRLLGLAGIMLLVHDGVQALSDHSFDIGKAIGKAADWIRKTGATQMKDSVTSAFRSMYPAIASATQNLIKQMINALDPTWYLKAGFKMGWDAMHGYDEGRYGIDPSTLPKVPIGLPQRVAPPLTKVPAPGYGLQLPPPTPSVIQINVTPGASSGNSAQDNRHAMNVARKTAQAVAQVINGVARTGTALAGATISPVNMSAFETTGALA